MVGPLVHSVSDTAMAHCLAFAVLQTCPAEQAVDTAAAATAAVAAAAGATVAEEATAAAVVVVVAAAAAWEASLVDKLVYRDIPAYLYLVVLRIVAAAMALVEHLAAGWARMPSAAVATSIVVFAVRVVATAKVSTLLMAAVGHCCCCWCCCSAPALVEQLYHKAPLDLLAVTKAWALILKHHQTCPLNCCW